MKEQIDILSVAPSKRLYLSIIADYDILKAICELIDNAIDIWVKNGRKFHLLVSITLDTNQQRISVIDNAGGISNEFLSMVVSPGHTSNLETDQTIGIFGVGTKRAVVALSQNICISTRQSNDTYQIEFGDDWLSTEEWELPVYRVDNIEKNTTRIDLLRLRSIIDSEVISKLTSHLSVTYAKFLINGNLTLLLNNNPVEPIEFDVWAYPPNFEPRFYKGILKTKDGKEVCVNAIAGLSMVSSPAGGEYGVYFYCNDRLIARGLKTFDVGFGPGLSGKPHADISLARIIVYLNGEARLMPWNSSKSDINPSHEVFIALRNWLIRVVKDYTSLSRRFSKVDGGWPENIFQYNSGEMHEVIVKDFPSVNTSYLPPLPNTKPSYSHRIQQQNKEIYQTKPWTIGLSDSIIAVDLILKNKSLSQKNRIALILLDSTLEIAFKEYLVNEVNTPISEANLSNIMRNRSSVHTEIKKYVTVPSTSWKKIVHYYHLRCQLIHQRASISIDNPEIADFRNLVQKTIHKLFKLNL